MNPNLEQAMEDPEFTRLLEESESYFEDAQSFYSWDPPDGQTICILQSIRQDKIADKRLTKDVLRVRATVEIQQGDFEGKTFEISGTFGWTLRNFTGLKTLASLLAGEPISRLVEGLDILNNNVGAWLRVTTSRSPREGGGEPWVNHRVLERLEDSDVESMQEAPAEE